LIGQNLPRNKKKLFLRKYIKDVQDGLSINVCNLQISQINIQSNEANGKDSDDAPEQFNVAEASLLRKVIRKGLIESKNDIEVQRQNPNSPLYSVKTFEALNL
jgi:hypothetical protein